MEIKKANVLGFCFGVRRATKIVTREVDSGRKLFTLGDIVHNPDVVETLAKKGATPVRSLDEVKNKRVAITAHGVGEDIYRDIQKRDLDLVDTTCPIVRRAQEVVQEMTERGYQVVLYGEEDHPEVKGILGWTGGEGRAILDVGEELKILKEKICLISQTTKGQRAFVHFAGKFLEKYLGEADSVHIVDTTCPETGKRYKAATNLAKWADLLIVVGGRNSANTKKLASVCRQTGVKTYHIENNQELKGSWFKGIKRVGVTAGASTPDSAIQKVVDNLANFSDRSETSTEIKTGSSQRREE